MGLLVNKAAAVLVRRRVVDLFKIKWLYPLLSFNFAPSTFHHSTTHSTLLKGWLNGSSSKKVWPQRTPFGLVKQGKTPRTLYEKSMVDSIVPRTLCTSSQSVSRPIFQSIPPLELQILMEARSTSTCLLATHEVSFSNRQSLIVSFLCR